MKILLSISVLVLTSTYSQAIEQQNNDATMQGLVRSLNCQYYTISECFGSKCIALNVNTFQGLGRLNIDLSKKTYVDGVQPPQEMQDLSVSTPVFGKPLVWSFNTKDKKPLLTTIYAEPQQGGRYRYTLAGSHVDGDRMIVAAGSCDQIQ